MGKTTDNKYFYEVVKTKHVWLLSNTCQIQRCVEKYTHVCKKPNKCVFFQTGGATFCICTCIWVFAIWYSVLNLYLSFQRRPCNIRCQEHLQNSLEKNHLFGNSHTCVEKNTQVKNKNIKTNKFCMWSPPRLKDFL